MWEAFVMWIAGTVDVNERLKHSKGSDCMMPSTNQESIKIES